jgi:CubicO group peptidase (beta-lactamase class C family)
MSDRAPGIPPDLRPGGPFAQFLDQLAQAGRFSGCVLVAQEATPLFAVAYGWADQAHHLPNHLDTKFNLGSLTKMFTAVAIAQLAEQGRLAFQDPLGQYLPAWPAAEARPVTIHQLLTHTAGLGDYLADADYRATHATRHTVADLLPLIIGQPLAFPPGSLHCANTRPYSYARSRNGSSVVIDDPAPPIAASPSPLWATPLARSQTALLAPLVRSCLVQVLAVFA